jgi:peptidoglycan biosynthesis protein MviN/MurJ (putative lipid II flippase)
MNPDYLWLTGALQLLTLFVVAPTLGIAIAYAAWRGKPQNVRPDRYPMLCIASGIIAVLLFGFAKWLDADVRTPQYFLQVACVLISGLLFGVFMGYGISVLLGSWRWHKRTRL